MEWGKKLDFIEYVLGRVFGKTWIDLQKFIFSSAEEFASFNHLVDVCNNHNDLNALARVYAEKI